MTISQVCKKYSVTADTLRYYEKAGILPAVNRKGGGARDYDENDLAWVEFVLCMRKAGMSVESLTKYVALCFEGDQTAGERKKMLEDQREELRQKAQQLNSALSLLDYKIDKYEQVMLQNERRLTSNNNKTNKGE